MIDPNVQFLSVRAILLCLLFAVQVHLFRILTRQILSPAWRIRFGRIAAGIFVAVNLPGVYLAFGSRIPLPEALHLLAIYPYAVWTGASFLLYACCGIWKFASLTRPLFRGNPSRQDQPNNAEQREPRRMEADASRRRFLRTAAAGVSIYSFGGAAAGAMTHGDFEVVRRIVRMGSLAASQRGTRIVLLSDIHAGMFMSEEEIAGCVAAVNGLHPDAVLIPGDFVTNRTAEILPACRALHRLRSTYGVYSCLGNHDFYADDGLITQELRRAGITVLRDEHRVIHLGGAPFALIGVDDIRGNRTLTRSLGTACGGLDSSLPSILLCHKPYYFDEVPQFGIDLVVAGHTHGGQVVLAEAFGVAVTPALLVSPYVSGLYAEGESRMYVTRGIGTVGLPVRFNCPPEITLLMLA